MMDKCTLLWKDKESRLTLPTRGRETLELSFKGMRKNLGSTEGCLSRRKCAKIPEKTCLENS